MDEKEKVEEFEGWNWYVIDRVLAHYPARSDRSALKSLRCGHTFEKWKASVLEIQALWRACVVTQSDMDWSRLGHDTPWVQGIKTLQAANCPPVGVTTIPRDDQDYRFERPCRLTMICPFCWCRRYVEQIYTRFYSALFEYKKRRPELWLVTTEFSIKRRSAQCVKAQAKHIMAEELIEQSEGAVTLYLAEPTASYRRPFRMIQRVLAVVDKGGICAKTLCDQRWTKRTKVREATPMELVHAVGRVARYPSKMLLGDQDKVKRLLDGFTPSRRMMEFYGCLRGSKREEMAWPSTQFE